MSSTYLYELFLKRLRFVWGEINRQNRRDLQAFLRALAKRGQLPVADLDDAWQEISCRLWIALREGEFLELVLNINSKKAQTEVRRWLFGVARNVAKEYLGSVTRRQRLIAKISAKRSHQKSTVDCASLENLHETFQGCPARERELMELLILGWTVSEIASIQGLNRSTIHRQVKGLRRLASQLMDQAVEVRH